MYKELCYSLFRDRLDYYLRWYHSRPLLIGSARRDELCRMHELLYKCIAFMAENWREFVPRYMPLSDKEMEILDYQSFKPFAAGAYRPDYIISEKGELLLVEITCRFFGHGIWHGYPAYWHADRFMDSFPGEQDSSLYEEMFAYMKDYVPEGKDIVVLMSSDKTAEIDCYKAFYEHFGHGFKVLEADEVETMSHLWKNGAFVISALNQKDLMSYGMDTLRSMVDAGMVNDFRTILLTHDKRFLRLVFVDEFTSHCLTPEETSFLRAHTIPTYLYGEEAHAPHWADALEHKDDYIVKPYNLGKSVGLYSGCMCSEAEWRSIFEGPGVESMILQPFIRQRRYPLVWEGVEYQDYICGMMLCVDDRYFGSGMVRCSSAPVTNKGDNRKKSVIHSDSVVLVGQCDVL